MDKKGQLQFIQGDTIYKMKVEVYCQYEKVGDDRMIRFVDKARIVIGSEARKNKNLTVIL